MVWDLAHTKLGFLTSFVQWKDLLLVDPILALTIWGCSWCIFYLLLKKKTCKTNNDNCTYKWEFGEGKNNQIVWNCISFRVSARITLYWAFLYIYRGSDGVMVKMMNLCRNQDYAGESVLRCNFMETTAIFTRSRIAPFEFRRIRTDDGRCRYAAWTSLVKAYMGTISTIYEKLSHHRLR